MIFVRCSLAWLRHNNPVETKNGHAANTKDDYPNPKLNMLKDEIIQEHHPNNEE
jgi:hypothetical protein